MNKKGFTLVELLAVIIILGIIAIITTPILLRVVSNARDEGEKQSVALYGEAVKNAALNYQIVENKKLTGVFTTSTDGHKLIDSTTGDMIDVDFSKSTVMCGRVSIVNVDDITLSGCKVGTSETYYSYSSKTGSTYKLSCDDGNCNNQTFLALSEGVTEYGNLIKNEMINYKRLNGRDLSGTFDISIVNNVAYKHYQ